MLATKELLGHIQFNYELVRKRLIKSTKLIHSFNELSELHN